jgi:2-aminoadipate transaminase
MLRALSSSFPPEVRWTRPKGGLFLWVTLPEGLDASALLARALQQKVAFVPGTSFFPGGGGANTLRLNFSYCRPAVIEEGVRRLASVVCDGIANR